MGQLQEGESKGNLLCLAGRLQPWDSWKRGETGEICSAWLVGCSHGTAGTGGKRGKSALPAWQAAAMGESDKEHIWTKRMYAATKGGLYGQIDSTDKKQKCKKVS